MASINVATVQHYFKKTLKMQKFSANIGQHRISVVNVKSIYTF